MAYIYKITNTINDKFYIGKTKRTTINRRWWEHKQKLKSVNYRHPLYDSMRAYDIENFKIEIIEECSLDMLDEREKFWISKLSPEYNLTSGGEGGDTFTRRPEELKEVTRKKLSEASEINWKKEEYRKKVSNGVKTAWKNEHYREKITKLARQKARDPEYIKKVSDGVRKAIEAKRHIWSECKRGKKNNRWLGYIKMYYPDGTLYKTYETAVDCCKDTNINSNLIRKKAKNNLSMERGKYKGFYFELIKG